MPGEDALIAPGSGVEFARTMPIGPIGPMGASEPGGASPEGAAGALLPAAPLLQPGQHLGSYEILRLLGRGGMGEVFAARHLYLDRQAAIKVLYPQLSHNPRFATSFLNEARAINLVRHPGVVEIYEFDVLPDGTAYIVMEMLEGETMARWLSRSDDIPLPEALSVAHQIAEALRAAHDKGVVHRDLKPENIMLIPAAGAGLRAKILDFGLARIARASRPAAAATNPGIAVGTPAYMSPEQWLSAPDIGDRTDIYSFGVILFEMLARRLPFDADETFRLMELHVRGRPPSLAEVNPTLPPELVALVHDMLTKRARARPAVGEVLARLARLSPAAGALSDETPVLPRARSEASLRAPRTTRPERPFLLLQPAAAAPPAPPAALPTQVEAAARIVVLGADPDYGELLCSVLHAEGFACLAAPSREELPRLLREFQPQLVLLDVDLPGKSGFRLCWELKAAARGALVVLVSAKGDEIDQQLAMKMGADALLRRPIELAELLAVIRLLLDRQGSAA